METRREKKERAPLSFHHSVLLVSLDQGPPPAPPLWLWLPPENILAGCGRDELNFGCSGGSPFIFGL